MGFLGGAALLTAAVAVSKLLGALYKIPLGNLLGSRGMGCFQAAYNVYGVLLTLSTAGLPLAMSRLIAQSRGRPRRQRRIFHVALALFLALGLVGSGVMLTFPRQLAGLLHNELAAPPSGYWPRRCWRCVCCPPSGATPKGRGQMLPTAVSQVVESAGKLVVGLGLTWYLLTVQGVSPEIGAAGAMAGVTVGSLLALLVPDPAVAALLHGQRRSTLPVGGAGSAAEDRRSHYAGAGGMSFITLLDQSVAMDALQSRLGLGLEEANRQYGEYAFALTLFSLPPSFLYPISVSLVPAISGALGQGDRRTARRHTRTALRMALLLALPSGIGLSVLAGPVLRLLYPAQVQTAAAAAHHLRVLGLAAVCVCLMVVSGGILQAWGHEHIPVVTLLTGGAVKIAVSYQLVSDPAWGIRGRRRGNTALLCAYCGDEPTGGGTHHWDSLSLGRSSPDAGGSGGHGGDGLRLLPDAGTPGFPAAGRAGSRSGSRCGVRRSRPAAGGSAPRRSCVPFLPPKSGENHLDFFKDLSQMTKSLAIGA